MRIDSLIRCDKSTETNPIRFFQSFFSSSDKVLHARNYFLPKIGEFYNENPPVFVESIDETNMSFTVNYEVVANEDDWNDTDWFPIHKWETKTYVFNDELYQYLTNQFFISKRLIEEKMDLKPNEYKVKESLKTLISRCHILLQKIKGNNDLLPYDNCDRPIKAIIRFIYKEYPDQAPKTDDEIHHILTEDIGYKNYYKQKTLSSGIIKKILELKNPQTTNLLFEMDYFNNELSTGLGLFIEGCFDKMKSPLNFKTNIQASYYLIHQIIEKSSPFTAAGVARSKKIFMGERPFTENSYSVNAKRFIKNNENIKYQIDSLIQSYLK